MGNDPNEKIMKVAFLPIRSDTAAQTILPANEPAETINMNFAAKAEVTICGIAAVNTSFIIGLATLKRAIPPAATAKKEVPKR